MMRLSLLAATAALTLSGTAALAWGDMYMGDPTNDPNSNMLVHAYKGANFCPAGLQPVTVGGVICCGNPNAGYYIDRPGGARKTYGKVSHKPAPRAYAPAGEKGVVYR